MSTLAAHPVEAIERPVYRARRNRSANARQIFLPLLGLAVAALLWWLFTTPRLHDNSLRTAFSPELALPALVRLFHSGEINPHIVASLWRVVIGLALATCIGFPLGVVIGLSRGLEQSTSAVFQGVRMISPLSWMPIAVMLFGVGDLPVYFLLAIAATWPILLNTIAGVHAIDRRWIQLARSLCATRSEIIRTIVLPAIVAHVLTGLRLAVGVIWIVLVPAEMLGVSSGLGYYILDTRDRLNYSELTAVILLIGLLGFLLDASLQLASRRWIRVLR